MVDEAPGGSNVCGPGAIVSVFDVPSGNPTNLETSKHVLAGDVAHCHLRRTSSPRAQQRELVRTTDVADNSFHSDDVEAESNGQIGDLFRRKRCL